MSRSNANYRETTSIVLTGIRYQHLASIMFTIDSILVAVQMRVCGRVVRGVTPRSLAVVPVVVAVPHLLLLLHLQPVQECGAAMEPSTRTSPDSQYHRLICCSTGPELTINGLVSPYISKS